jgi:hypothetical protein
VAELVGTHNVGAYGAVADFDAAYRRFQATDVAPERLRSNDDEKRGEDRRDAERAGDPRQLARVEAPSASAARVTASTWRRNDRARRVSRRSTNPAAIVPVVKPTKASVASIGLSAMASHQLTANTAVLTARSGSRRPMTS